MRLSSIVDEVTKMVVRMVRNCISDTVQHVPRNGSLLAPEMLNERFL